ncbi:MAG: hypothetical protein QNJ70_14210 [Xenococcaceae cyanobacterium MO_207.B15]|nr:hypothetical protein [Xenococcaceae cyanobacterium MO_207.B15]
MISHNLAMEEIKALTKVIGPSSYPGSIRVILGYGYGHIDGGVEDDIKINLIPQDLRMPNSEFVLVWDKATGKIIRVERTNNTTP